MPTDNSKFDKLPRTLRERAAADVTARESRLSRPWRDKKRKKEEEERKGGEERKVEEERGRMVWGGVRRRERRIWRERGRGRKEG